MSDKTTHSPLISVLIANYNNGCYLLDAIKSIMSQAYKEWEIVIVDDGSSDNSIELYKELTVNPRIRVFFNEKNYGVGYTKRRCVENAQGDLFVFVDPDDVLVGEDVFDSAVYFHAAHPSASMVYSGMYRANENLVIQKESPGCSIEEGASALEMKSWPFRPFLSFKRSSYLKTEGINPDMRRAVDYDLYYKLEEVGEVIHIDYIQYIQRNSPQSISLNDNSYKAAVWHSYACVNAMIRRGLKDESLMLFPIEHVLRKEYKKGYDKATSSRIYRLGKIIAFPVLLLRKLLKN